MKKPKTPPDVYKIWEEVRHDPERNGTVMPKSLSFQQLKVASVFERSDWVGRVSVFGV